MHALNKCGVKPSKNYAFNIKYALNNGQRLTTSFYGSSEASVRPFLAVSVALLSVSRVSDGCVVLGMLDLVCQL